MIQRSVTVLALVAAGQEVQADDLNRALKQSAVMSALFTNAGKDGFLDPRKNEALKAVLAKKPALDFFEAAAVGTSVHLEAALARDPALLNAYHALGWTALHFAAFAGNVETTKWLLARGAEVHARATNKFKNTPLLASMLTGQLETARLLLEHGASVLERQSFGFSALHEAALIGRCDLIELLLAHGAELEAKTNDGRTPLTEALRGGRAEAAALLRAKGAVEVPMNEVLSGVPKE